MSDTTLTDAAAIGRELRRWCNEVRGYNPNAIYVMSYGVAAARCFNGVEFDPAEVGNPQVTLIELGEPNA